MKYYVIDNRDIDNIEIIATFLYLIEAKEFCRNKNLNYDVDYKIYGEIVIE